MRHSHAILVATLLALVAVYAGWFVPRGETVALVVFGVPPLLFAAAVWRRRRQAPFWAGVLALAWFSHGIMVAWTRPGERGWALAETALALVVVLAASLPGLRARFAGRRAAGR